MPKELKKQIVLLPVNIENALFDPYLSSITCGFRSRYSLPQTLF
jgi:hypothetical protein